MELAHSRGYVKRGFEQVEEEFERMFERKDEENGAAFAAYYKGEMVVDLWGGYADRHAGRAWSYDTTNLLCSAGKTVSTIVAHMLIDRGLLQYNDLVTKYWPEFGQHGKEQTTVAHILNHQAGLAVIDQQITMDMVARPASLARIFEQQKPNWGPGTQVGYHVITHGWLIDQLCMRVDPQGRTTGKFFRDEIAEPYDLDMYVGLPTEKFHYLARWNTEYSLRQYVSVLLNKNTIPNVMHYWGSDKNLRALRQGIKKNPSFIGIDRMLCPLYNPRKLNLEIPSANAVGTARSLAKLYALFGSGTLVSKDLLRRIMVPEKSVRTKEILLGWEVVVSHGFTYDESPEADWEIGYPGLGGQMGRWNPKRDLAYAHVTNTCTTHEALKFEPIVQALYKCLQKLPDAYVPIPSDYGLVKPHVQQQKQEQTATRGEGGRHFSVQSESKRIMKTYEERIVKDGDRIVSKEVEASEGMMDA